jgi:hypothetical protein
MTATERDLQIFILRVLLAANDAPMTDDSLRTALRSAFLHVAFTAADLRRHIQDAEEKNLISGTLDEVFGLMWALTPKGKIKAQQLR